MPTQQRPWGPSTGTPSGLSVNTLNAQAGTNPPPLPTTQVVTVATETVIINPGLVSDVTANLPLSVAVPPNSPTEKIPFDLNLSGSITAAGDYTATVKLYAGQNPTGTPADDTNVIASGAVTVDDTTEPFFIKATMIYDSVTGKLRGQFSGQIGATLIASTSFENVVTGIENTSDPVVQLYPTITFSAANAANAITVQAFSIG
jgi:hypothetical protein